MGKRLVHPMPGAHVDPDGLYEDEPLTMRGLDVIASTLALAAIVFVIAFIAFGFLRVADLFLR